MKDYICSIDIGTSLVRAIVARKEGHDQVEVLGVGSAPSRGVRIGSIVNIETTVQAVTDAVREAELMSGLVVDEALVNITGKMLHGDNSRGVVAVTNRDRIVRESDVLRVIEGAQNIRIPADQEIIHVLSREFTVDDQGGIRDPVGMTGVRLEADVHIVTASATALNNLEKAVVGAGIRISDGVMSALASADAVLSDGERDLGTAVIDIGGGIIDIIMYLEGGVFYSTVVPLGGNHVTQDLSIGLKVPVEVSEMIKKTYGAALVSMVDPIEKIELPGVPGRPARWVLRQDIAAIMEPRLREIFEIVDEKLIRSGKKNFLSGGVVLTGGSSQVEGIAALAEDVLGLSATTAMPRGVSGFAERVAAPEFATSVGLVHYAARAMREGRSVGGMARKGMFERVREWISENL